MLCVLFYTERCFLLVGIQQHSLPVTDSSSWRDIGPVVTKLRHGGDTTLRTMRYNAMPSYYIRQAQQPTVNTQRQPRYTEKGKTTEIRRRKKKKYIYRKNETMSCCTRYEINAMDGLQFSFLAFFCCYCCAYMDQLFREIISELSELGF